MCGIVGIVGKEEIAPDLVKCISRLEYRGYDSCGLATLNSGGIEVRKDVGPVSQVATIVPGRKVFNILFSKVLQVRI